MDFIESFLCAPHKAWLMSNPKANLRIWDEKLEIGKSFMLIRKLSSAERALSAAAELADIYLSSAKKPIGKLEIEMFSATVSELANCFSLQKEISKRNQIIME